MNIAKALKIKSRMVGELGKLQTDASSLNCTTDDQISSRTVDLVETWENIKKKQNELIHIKAAIAKASVGVIDKLVELAELKSYLTFISNLRVMEGVANVATGYGANAGMKTLAYVNHISLLEKNKSISSLQKKINNCQDEIDDYNASTLVQL